MITKKKKNALKAYEEFNFKRKFKSPISIDSEKSTRTEVTNLFLKLTNTTTPAGYENLMEPFLPPGWKRDAFSNYYYKIGDSETMFTSHLDTADYKKPTPIRHVFTKYENRDIVSTYGNYILGADDKAGAAIMIHMINKNIPGLYYFFLGEERGCQGSKALNKGIKSGEYKDNILYRNIKRVISFDRKGYGSIISRQCGDECCSKDFVNALSEEFSKHGLKFVDDPNGVYTDSYSFIYTYPECTNLSVGYFNQHSSKEIQDLTYLNRLADACLKINWESLPTRREPKEPVVVPRKKHTGKRIVDLKDCYISVKNKEKAMETAKILKDSGYKVFNYEQVESGNLDFIDFTKGDHFYVYSARKDCFYITKMSLTQRQMRSAIVDLKKWAENPQVDIRTSEMRKKDAPKMILLSFGGDIEGYYIAQDLKEDGIVMYSNTLIQYTDEVNFFKLADLYDTDDIFYFDPKEEVWVGYQKNELPNDIKSRLY